MSRGVKQLFVSTVALVLLLGLLVPREVAAETAPPEKQKIETLIQRVGELKGVRFIRNGWTYSAESAATFLRRKWEASESEVTTAHDFIEKIASFSATSGKPYLIRFTDGQEIKSRDFLLAVLKKIES